jgi:hypothetical protein
MHLEHLQWGPRPGFSGYCPIAAPSSGTAITPHFIMLSILIIYRGPSMAHDPGPTGNRQAMSKPSR